MDSSIYTDPNMSPFQESEVVIDTEFYSPLSVADVDNSTNDNNRVVHISITYDQQRGVHPDTPLSKRGVLGALIHPENHEWEFWTDERYIRSKRSLFRKLGYDHAQTKVLYVHKVTTVKEK